MAHFSPLLALPAEFRNKIWFLVLVRDEPIQIPTVSRPVIGYNYSAEPPLLEAGTSIRDEAAGIHYGNNTFMRRIEDKNNPVEALKSLKSAFDALGEPMCKLIKEMEVEFEFNEEVCHHSFLMQWAELFTGSPLPPPGKVHACRAAGRHLTYTPRLLFTSWNFPSVHLEAEKKLEWYDVLFSKLELAGRKVVQKDESWQRNRSVNLNIVKMEVVVELEARFKGTMNEFGAELVLAEVQRWLRAVTDKRTLLSLRTLLTTRHAGLRWRDN